MSNGALGCSISGAGPTVFAWAEAPYAEGIRAAMVEAFNEHGLDSDHWVSAIEGGGARVIDGGTG
jgi:homoserine kinase